jgi:hypothetical protein
VQIAEFLPSDLSKYWMMMLLSALS